MHIRVYSVYDKAAGAYLNPFCVHTDGLAIRYFEELVNDPEHVFGRHPDQFTLFFIGVYDQDTAMFTNDTGVLKLIAGHEVSRAAANALEELNRRMMPEGREVYSHTSKES